ANVTSLQRNDPDPPTTSEEMVRGPFTRGAATICIIGKTLAPLVAVPLFHAGEPRPDSVNRMLRVGPKISKFPGAHRCAPSSIDDPTRPNSAFARGWRGGRPARKIDNYFDRLSACAVQFAVHDLGGTPEVATCPQGQVEQVRIKLCTVNLEPW